MDNNSALQSGSTRWKFRPWIILINPSNFSSNDFNHPTSSNASSSAALKIIRTRTVTTLVDTALCFIVIRIVAVIEVTAIRPGALHTIDAAQIVATTVAIVLYLFHEVLEGFLWIAPWPVIAHENRKTYCVPIILFIARSRSRAGLRVGCIVVRFPESCKRVSVVARWPRSRRLIKLNRYREIAGSYPMSLPWTKATKERRGRMIDFMVL